MSNTGPYRYRADVLAHLWRHGVQPRSTTSPELVRGFVRDLYKYEIRSLRQRMLDNQFPKDSYSDRVEALRRQYPVLALPARLWIEQ